MSTWKLSETEKENAIHNIVRNGVVSPADKIKEFLNAGKRCRLHVLFFGVGDCLFLGILITVCLWLLLLQFHIQTILCSVFACSPFAYIALFFLTTWKEHMVQLYEMKMSCHYTIRQVTAWRMIYFGFGNMLINTAVLALFVHMQNSFVPFWKTLGLSFASLFLYGIMMLFFQIKGRLYLSVAIPPVIWTVLNLLVILNYGVQVEKVLLNLANGLVLVFLFVTCMAYLVMLYSFSTTKCMGAL